MRTYSVTIYEYRTYIITVEANNNEEALDTAFDRYKNTPDIRPDYCEADPDSAKIELLEPDPDRLREDREDREYNQ